MKSYIALVETTFSGHIDEHEIDAVSFLTACQIAQDTFADRYHSVLAVVSKVEKMNVAEMLTP